MPNLGPRTARTLLAAGTLAAALALTACDPSGGPDAAPTAGTGTTSPAAAASSPAAAPPASTPAAAPTAATTTPGSTAGKHRLATAATAGGLARVTGQGAVSDVPVDPGEMRTGMNLVVENFRGNGRTVLFVGVDGVPEDPNKRREHLWRGLIDYAVGNGSTGSPGTGTPYAAGPLGGSLECLPMGADALCGWADSSTAAVALFPGTAPAAAARQFAAMRADLEH
ncbi:hypothetical protein [Kitasatospora sp. NPDC059571]|uniref:hypothetical protein n=1 Tax=Kitasatospora sp. NPDC059571 TaxID=3346871 RepID=UPI0036C4A2E1